jgi:hypothetical protein
MECYRFVNLFTRKFGAWILRIEKRLEYFYFFYLGVTLSSLRLDSYLSKRISASPPNAGLAITKQYCHAKERSISDLTKLQSLDPSYPRDDKTKGGQNILLSCRGTKHLCPYIVEIPRILGMTKRKVDKIPRMTKRGEC